MSSPTLPLAAQKPNQQQIIALRAGDDPAAQRRQAQLETLGRELRARLAGWTLPLMAVQSTGSLLRGTAPIEDWGVALAALHGVADAGGADRRGGNHPSWGAAGGAVHASFTALHEVLAATPAAPAAVPPPAASATPAAPSPARPWALLADYQDLLGLPRALDRWGHGHVAVGATLPSGGETLLVVAPTRAAYARLCRLLSWHLEEPEAWQAWQDGRHPGPDLADLVCLAESDASGDRLAMRGAEVFRRAGARPVQGPSRHPILAAPLLCHIDEHDRAASPVLHAIRTRATVRRQVEVGLALCELPQLREAYRGFEAQLEAGAELLARCRFAPGREAAGEAPLSHLPPHLPDTGSEDPLLRLREESLRGLDGRYVPEQRAEARARLERELRAIGDKRFAGYMLAVWRLARGRRTCGRGSAASSMVCYCLGLTNVDPLAYHLLFERFLAPERSDPPDIDIDFPWDERDLVLARTITEYGWEHVAMVATHQTLHRWSALREAARAYGLPDHLITQVRDRLQGHESYGTPLGEPLGHPWPAIFEAVAAMSGAPRHLGVHCGGVVITGIPIRELAVVHPAAKTLALPGPGPAATAVPVPTVSWEKDGCEDLGLVKIDLLGNRSLAVIRDCLEDLAGLGRPLREEGWRPQQDPATCALVASGDTMGCFYIESPAMRQLQAKIGSGDFDRLVIHSSIIRPAGNAWISTYIARYHRFQACDGRITAEEEEQWYPHAALKRLLSASFGILSYQEDVMLVTQEMAGFGSREANQLRKALGRADTPQRLRSLVGRFRAGCLANQVPERVIELVWSMIASFAGYSFCKAHSASYAMVSFQCAYLKAHHPALFLARVIANEGGFYGPCAYVEEARRLQVGILGPCVLASEWKTAPEGHEALRLGFHLVHGLSRATAQALIEARRQQPFRGLRDLKRRGHVAADELRALEACGALDALLSHASAGQRTFLATLVARQADETLAAPAAAGQQLLDLPVGECSDPPLPVLRDPTPASQRQRRFAALGLLPEAHPLSLWRLPPRPLRCRDVTPSRLGQRVVVIAWSITRKQVVATYFRDEAGEPLAAPRFEAMAFVTLEDEDALLETVWFPDCYRRFGALLERNEPMRLVGRVAVEHGFATLTVERVETVATPR